MQHLPNASISMDCLAISNNFSLSKIITVNGSQATILNSDLFPEPKLLTLVAISFSKKKPVFLILTSISY
jgi:hypothetical protein